MTREEFEAVLALEGYTIKLVKAGVSISENHFYHTDRRPWRVLLRKGHPENVVYLTWASTRKVALRRAIRWFVKKGNKPL